jgi:prepilin-type N-terminal cleavage/methylation domain-containing protein
MTLLENYLKSKRVQKVLNTKKGQEGFSLVELVVVIAVLAILSAVAIPAFNGVQVRARAAAVKNGLVNGIKECVILESNFDDTSPQTVVQSFPGNYSGYTITEWQQGDRDGTCYNALAETDNEGNEADFWIEMDVNGNVTKGCTDGELPGCNLSGELNDDDEPINAIW